MSVVASCRKGSRLSGLPQVEYPGEYLHATPQTKLSLLCDHDVSLAALRSNSCIGSAADLLQSTDLMPAARADYGLLVEQCATPRVRVPVTSAVDQRLPAQITRVHAWQQFYSLNANTLHD